MKYKALLSDLDGTLMETTHLWVEATNRAFDEHGVALPVDAAEHFFGRTLGDVLTEFGYSQEQIATIRASRDLHLPDLLGPGAQWLPGAEEFLEELRVPSAIVTSSRLKDLALYQERLRIHKLVQAVVPIDHVRPRHKPDPYPLQLACERLGIATTDVLYLGDQLADKIAAERAGIDFVLLRGTFTPSSLTAEREASSYNEIRQML